jgi:hypothetical protein
MILYPHYFLNYFEKYENLMRRLCFKIMISSENIDGKTCDYARSDVLDHYIRRTSQFQINLRRNL